MAGAAPPLVTIASQHGAGGDVVAPRVAELLGAPFLDRFLPADPEEPEQGPLGALSSLARASTMLASAPVERLDLDEGRARTELAEFLARAREKGGVVLGRGGMLAVGGAPGVLHAFLTGPFDGRVARVAAREGVARDEAERRVRAHDRARRDYIRRTFGVEADDRTLFHLIIDTIAMGIDPAVELVVTASRARTRRASPNERS